MSYLFLHPRDHRGSSKNPPSRWALIGSGRCRPILSVARRQVASLPSHTRFTSFAQLRALQDLKLLIYSFVALCHATSECLALIYSSQRGVWPARFATLRCISDPKLSSQYLPQLHPAKQRNAPQVCMRTSGCSDTGLLPCACELSL